MLSLLPKRPLVKAGDKFGRLSVVGVPFFVRVGSAQKRMQHVVCECECGSIVIARCPILIIGRLLSCGCYQSDVTRQRNYKHGFAPRGKPKPYDTWMHMRERCYNQKHTKCWHRYGGRGITICDEWKDSPEAFCKWALANGWHPDLTIDRINTWKPYSPQNCRWVTRLVQGQNRRNTTPVQTVIEIHQRAALGVRQIDLAREYRVSKGIVNRIANNKTWKGITHT